MHDALRQRLQRRIESLPDAQVYQVLDYIEFLEAKYSEGSGVEASGLQKFAEGLEDKLRRKAVSPATIREAFQVISAADRVLSGVSSAGRQILNDLNSVLEPSTDAGGGESGTLPQREVGGTPASEGTAEPGPREGETV